MDHFGSVISLNFLNRRPSFPPIPVPSETYDEEDDVIMDGDVMRAEVRRIVQLKKEGRVSVWSSSNVHCASNRL